MGLPTPASRLAVAAVVVLVLAAAASIDTANEVLMGARAWVVTRFDWLFVFVATASVASVIVLAFHPRAKVRLGPDDLEPEFSRFAWLAMLFSAGLASGLLYWAAAEPILHQQTNPFLNAAKPLLSAATANPLVSAANGGSDAAARTALRVTIVHWGLHGWAFYVLAGLAIAHASYRRGRPLAFRSALLPLLGPKRVDRWPGVTVDLLALFGTVCGVATSIGISAGGMNATLGSLFDFEVRVSYQIAIVLLVCGLGIASALSGLSRGIRRLSELNIWVSAALLLAFLALGPTLYLVGLFFRTFIDYVLYVLPAGAWLADTAVDQAWQGDWTVFYWAWWLAWTPFVSVFIARISKGRTVREFVLAVLLVPAFVTIVWMTVFGGTALAIEAAAPGTVSTAVAQDPSLGLVAVIQNLGPPWVTTALTLTAAFLLLTWLITSLDSATLVICHLIGADEAAGAKLFWGGALAAVTAVLLLIGGLPALQAASVVVGLPLALVLLAVGAGLFVELFRS